MIGKKETVALIELRPLLSTLHPYFYEFNEFIRNDNMNLDDKCFVSQDGVPVTGTFEDLDSAQYHSLLKGKWLKTTFGDMPYALMEDEYYELEK